MKSCPQCARSYPDAEEFCAVDGAELQSGGPSPARGTERITPAESAASASGSAPADTLICQVCGGRALSQDEELCSFCGARLRPSAAASGAAEPERSTARVAPVEAPVDEQPPPLPPERAGGWRVLGVVGYTLAALVALAAGAWFALHLSSRQGEQPKLARESSPTAAASPAAAPEAVEPLVALAGNVPLQVTGVSASDPARAAAVFRSAFGDHKYALLDRYKRSLEGHELFHDAMVVTLRVLPSGAVSAGAVKTSTSPDPSLDSEVVNEMMSWRFGSFTGGAVEVDYPLVFAHDPGERARTEVELAAKLAALNPVEPPEYASAPAPPTSAAVPSAAAGMEANAPPIAEAPPPVATPKKPRKRRTELAARASAKPPLFERVEQGLRSDKRLRRVRAYTNGGVVTLYGKVFDDRAKALAERTARKVDGVTNVIDTLTTDTAAWTERENRINQELHNAGLGKVTAKVIGNDAYLDGEVTNGAERDRAVTIAESAAPVRVRTNMIRIAPPSMFGF